MKVNIITVYNSENCGSVLQAYALSKSIQEMGPQVSSVGFIYRPLWNTPNSICRCILGCSKNIMHGKFDVAKKRLERYRSFRTFRNKHIKVVLKQNVHTDDIIIIGSDTLWNLKDPYFIKMRRLFWAVPFHKNKKIVYAISVGNTYRTYFSDKFYYENINKFDFISARDDHTKEVISSLTTKKITMVCDPTLLLSADKYEEICPKIGDKNYILLYFFGHIDLEMQKELHKIAEQKKLQIISFGSVRDWCDKCIDSNPTFFLAYFKNAEYIVTNTFHGTVFSVLYSKRFSAFVDKKIKAKDFLRSIGLDDHVAVNAIDIFSLYDNCSVSSKMVQTNLRIMIDASKKYLQDSLGEK